MPLKNCERITPLLPLAPISAARAIADATSAAAAPSRRPASSMTSRMVRYMLMPVSPSGTGNTLSALIASTLRSRSSAAPENIARRSSPSRRSLA